MLPEHSRAIGNSINDLRNYILSLEAWKIVINHKEAELKNTIIVEFINPIATLAINMPFVVCSRFIYSITHLCHQVNRIRKKGWIDDLPLEKDIQFNHADNYCSQWKSYKKLKLALERIDNNEFRKQTLDFRNKYNHRIPPYIELGVSELVKRKVDNGKVTYVIGHTPPLKIDQLLVALKKQHDNCLKAFEDYKKLINEHISAIEMFLNK